MPWFTILLACTPTSVEPSAPPDAPPSSSAPDVATTPAPVAAAPAPATPPTPPPPQPPVLPPRPPVPELDPDSVPKLVLALGDPRTHSKAYALLNEHPEQVVQQALIEGYDTAASPVYIAQELLSRAPDAYDALAAREQARWTAQFVDEPRVVAEHAGEHAVHDPAGRSLFDQALRHADPEVRRLALMTLREHRAAVGPELYEALNAQMDYPPHRAVAESLLEGTQDPAAHALVDAHAHARFPLPTEGPDPDPNAPLPAPVVVRADTQGFTVRLYDSALVSSFRTVTAITPQGVEHVPLASITEDCVGDCGEAYCERVLRYRYPRPENGPLFVLAGRHELKDVQSTAWTAAGADDAGCDTFRAGSFHKVVCGQQGARSVIIQHDADKVLAAYEDYESGGTGDMPLSAVYRGTRVHFFEGLAKFSATAGWGAAVDGAWTRQVSERGVGTICDGGTDWSYEPDVVWPAPGGGRTWAEEWWVALEDADGNVRIARSQEPQLDRAQLRLATTDGWHHGPVSTAAFGEGCSDTGWPAQVGTPCTVRLNTQTYTFERVAVEGHVALRVLQLRGRHLKHADVAVVPADEADQVQLVLAADLDRDGGLDLLLKMFPKSPRRLLFLSRRRGDLFGRRPVRVDPFD